LKKRAFRSADSDGRLPNYPQLNVFRQSPRAVLASVGAALIASSCAPFDSSQQQPGGVAPMPVDAGSLDVGLGGVPELPPDSGIPDASSGVTDEDLPDAGQ